MSIRPASFTTPPSVLAQIANLPSLTMTELKALWKRLFGTEPPTHNRQFLERRIAYRLQEIEYRKVDRNTLERNKRRIEAIIESGKNRKRDRDIRLMPGTVLLREYQGKEHRVTVTLDGQYEFEQRLYPSLSRIAREITGTAWSGPVFFGLKPNATSKPATARGRK